MTAALRVNSTHTHADRGLDYYWTPREATAALARIEKLPRRIFDPCCGTGAILDILEALGHQVSGSDVADYGWRGTVVRDFLRTSAELNSTSIITNPPYRFARAFIEKAIAEKSPYIAALLRLNFLESMRRKPFFEKHPPSRIRVSSRRLPMMHRVGWTGKTAPSNQAYAWFVWDDSPEKMRVAVFDWRAT